jgi:hypothetical protein
MALPCAHFATLPPFPTLPEIADCVLEAKSGGGLVSDRIYILYFFFFCPSASGSPEL